MVYLWVNSKNVKIFDIIFDWFRSEAVLGWHVCRHWYRQSENKSMVCICWIKPPATIAGCSDWEKKASVYNATWLKIDNKYKGQCLPYRPGKRSKSDRVERDFFFDYLMISREKNPTIWLDEECVQLLTRVSLCKSTDLHDPIKVKPNRGRDIKAILGQSQIARRKKRGAAPKRKGLEEKAVKYSRKTSFIWKTFSLFFFFSFKLLQKQASSSNTNSARPRLVNYYVMPSIWYSSSKWSDIISTWDLVLANN